MTTAQWTSTGSFVALTLVVGISPLRGDDETEQIVADLKTKSAAVKSYRADTTATIQMMGKDMTMLGNVLFNFPQPTWRYG